ncbi:HPr kinase [Candidatus Vecturithrix granuli]|uniref:HPr kinase n=1 Tax=Vecturithrix granuli TaxID=1499967 RepID=A0A081BXA7_VECG1|nr:HPr kinase [Candidatus Vecturithrix granuli]
MTIRQVAEALSLEVLCSENNLDGEIEGGYASDMLSCVMAGAQKGNIWVTLLTHLNVIAVAVLLEIPAVIISEHAPIAPPVLQKAADEGIVVLHSTENTYTVVGKLYELGVK